MTIKILIVGDSGCGKTSLLLRYVDDIFTDSYITTIGVDYKTKMVQANGLATRVHLWDTAGQERFQSITSSYYRAAHGVILVFDATSALSFEHLQNWKQQIDKYAKPGISVMLLGNKYDHTACSVNGVNFADAYQFASDEVVNADTAKQWASNHSIHSFYKTSAKQNIGVQEAFDSFIQHICSKNITKTPTPSTTLQPEKPKTRKCCFD